MSSPAEYRRVSKLINRNKKLVRKIERLQQKLKKKGGDANGKTTTKEDQEIKKTGL